MPSVVPARPAGVAPVAASAQEADANGSWSPLTRWCVATLHAKCTVGPCTCDCHRAASLSGTV
jgi:hypothetical protein